jgi:hypothetical protein
MVAQGICLVLLLTEPLTAPAGVAAAHHITGAFWFPGPNVREAA